MIFFKITLVRTHENNEKKHDKNIFCSESAWTQGGKRNRKFSDFDEMPLIELV